MVVNGQAPTSFNRSPSPESSALNEEKAANPNIAYSMHLHTTCKAYSQAFKVRFFVQVDFIVMLVDSQIPQGGDTPDFSLSFVIFDKYRFSPLLLILIARGSAMSPRYRSQKSILTLRNRRRRMFLETLEDRRLLTVSTPQLMTPNFAGNNTGNAGTLLNEQVLSDDGRYLVFASTATNLVNNDTNGGLSDVYLRDLQTNTITIVSKRAGGGTPDGASDHPAISPDGNFVAFASYASDLDVTGTNSNNGHWQVYRWSRATGEIRLVSVNTDGTNGGDSTSWLPSISADGSRISFTTAASNLASGVTDTNGKWDVYYRNLTTSVTTLVTHSSSDPLLAADSYSSEPSRMSRDGSTIVYASLATNLAAGTSDVNQTGRDIVSYDIATGLNRYVSVETAAPASGNANSWRSNEALSADGVYEVFMSYASDLATNDFNGNSDVFLRNNLTGVTTLISRTTSGTSAAGRRIMQ